jgi:hypothetical protein
MSGPGRKNDDGKLAWHLLLQGCRLALIGAVEVLMIGARKYGPNNWQNVEPWTRYSDALIRHHDGMMERGLTARDHETGKLEAFHVLTNALFLAHKAAVAARVPGERVLPSVSHVPEVGRGAAEADVCYSFPHGEVPRVQTGGVLQPFGGES